MIGSEVFRDSGQYSQPRLIVTPDLIDFCLGVKRYLCLARKASMRFWVSVRPMLVAIQFEAVW